MFEKYIFQIPARLQAGIESGTLTRIGALVKDTNTGKIVAHLLETGASSGVIGKIINSPFAALSTVSSIAANIQISQLAKLVKELQLLQYTTLGVAITGIGISIAGFAKINAGINELQKSIEKISDKIEEKFEEMYVEKANNELFTLRGVLESIDATKQLSTPKSELISSASRLGELRGRFYGNLENLLQRPYLDQDIFAQLTSATVLSDNARVEAYLLANELDSAYSTAKSVAESYSNIFDSIIPYELYQKPLSRRLAMANQNYSRGILPRATPKDIVMSLRDITDAAMTKPLLIEELKNRKISGQAFLESLRREEKNPLVFLQFRE